MRKLLFAALFLLCFVSHVYAVAIPEEKVAASSDDCTVNSNSATFTLLNVLYVNDFSGINFDWQSGMRFTSVPVPAGATIDSANITLRAANTIVTFNATSWAIEDVDDAATFTNWADFNGRSRFGAVAWTPAAWASGNDYTSPDLKTLVQQVVDRGGWASGQDMAFFLTPTAGWNGISDRFTIASWDSDVSNAPTAKSGQVIMIMMD
jgi:hypothetical protein